LWVNPANKPWNIPFSRGGLPGRALQFSQVDGNTYQLPDYDGAANKVEITVNSGAGNVNINTK
jgi:hypothetical protein